MIETNHNDKLASGRLQWASEQNFYHQAVVFLINDAPAAWETVIETTNNNAVWAYDGSAWSSNGGWDNSDGKLTSAYSTMTWNRMKIVMNGKTEVFDLKPEYVGTSLKDLVNGAVKTEYLDSRGWKNTQTNPWNLSRNGHEPYVCNEPSFNFRYYESSGAHNFARIGFSLSQEAPCGHPGTAEGIGMIETNSNDKLASGRLQWSSEDNFYHQAVVELK